MLTHNQKSCLAMAEMILAQSFPGSLIIVDPGGTVPFLHTCGCSTEEANQAIRDAMMAPFTPEVAETRRVVHARAGMMFFAPSEN